MKLQLDYIVGPRRKDDHAQTFNVNKLWATSGLCEDTGRKSAKHFPKRKRTRKWTGWKPRTDEQKIEFKKKVMEDGEDGIDEDFATVQKTIEIAAGKVAHHTKPKREKLTKVRWRM